MIYRITLRAILANGDACTLQIVVPFDASRLKARRAALAKARIRFPELHKARRIRASAYS